MRRQNQQRFQQREGQRRRHHDGQRPHEIAHDAFHHQQRHERHHRRDDRDYNRPDDFLCPAHGRQARRQPFFHMAVAVLAHDDGIVHDHAQHDDQAEQTHHVDGDAGQGHHDERAQERNRQAHRDPKTEAQGEKKRQREEDQNETGAAVANH